ncbi:TRAP transporter substrate-binding protein DctP [Salipiger abyssi]|uniref:TRAP-type C4-dicarboxylate transport system, periplasmic component n=1 Tax=Salipiger abyssi TaxID=1250539 RepID=A0A1P8UN04_9RHOB|nr:TRAP transporter substrate-binding protein DctP [Salipiger abyssi]APZ50801.1 TRAP-type C4-dicarboxylate transport system, periplasmic component [Salipiger abyssi]
MTLMTKTTGLCALASVLAAGSASAERISFNVWVPPSEVIVTALFEPYFEAVEQATDGEARFQLFTAGQMLGPLNTMQGVRDGAVSGGMIDASYYGNDLPYTATFSDLIAFAPDPVAGAGASLETFFHDCPECLAEMAENNLIALGGSATAPYTIMCAKEIGSLDDLKGLRIRGSIDFHFALINALGANGVNIPFGDIAQSFERGNVDCMLGGPTWMETFGITELIETRLSTVSFGTISLPAMMSFQRSAWEGWSEEIRSAMIAALPEYIANGTIAVMENDEKAAATAREAGMAEVDLGQSIVDLREAFLVSERARVIEAGKARGAEDVEALLDRFLANYAEWEALSEQIGGDRAAFADALRARVYDDLPM